jgi:hypothetical protein
MRETSVELAIGDGVRLGEYILTIVDISGEDITLRVDQAADADVETAAGPLQTAAYPLPR